MGKSPDIATPETGSDTPIPSLEDVMKASNWDERLAQARLRREHVLGKNGPISRPPVPARTPALPDAVDDAAETVADKADDVADAAGDDAAAATAAAAVFAAEAVTDDDDASRATTIDLDKEMSEDDMAAAIAARFPNLSADQQASVTELVAAVRSLLPDDAEKLIQAGIEKSETLLERGASRPGRAEISRETNILEPVVLKWINDLDLARIKGVGVKYSDLLEEAGVDTVVELAQRNPANLYKKLVEVNEEQNLVEAMPSEQEVADWVAQAKELPRVITY